MVKTPHLHYRVRSLVGELRSHMLHSTANIYIYIYDIYGQPVMFCTDTNVAGPRGLRCLFLNMPGTRPPQGLCMCFFLCLERSSTDIHITPSLIFLRSSGKYHLLCDAFLTSDLKLQRCSPPPKNVPLLIFLGLPLTSVEPAARVKWWSPKCSPSFLLPPPFPPGPSRSSPTHVSIPAVSPASSHLLITAQA